MYIKYRCISNNPLFKEKDFPFLEFHDTDVLSLFKLVRNEIERGSKLLSHPLTGSIRPDITPYKTILLSQQTEKPDYMSVLLIEKAIRYTEDLYKLRDVPLFMRWGENAKADFQLIDYSIIRQALDVSA